MRAEKSGPVTPPAPRSARGAQRRRALIEAAIITLREHGVAATSLREVASVAGISPSGLLRHFPNKQSLIRAVLHEVTGQLDTATTDADLPAALAASDRIPGYQEIFTEVLGEPADSPYGARDLVQARAARWQRMFSDALGGVPRPTEHDPLQVLAAWHGLHVLARYLPHRIEPTSILLQYLAENAATVTGDDAGVEPVDGAVPQLPTQPELVGYAVGRDQRARIVDAALTAFANEGYIGTSMSAVAERLNVSKSGLFHHFPTKEDLLREVMIARDRRTWQLGEDLSTLSTTEWIRRAPVAAAEANEQAPGLIEAYCALVAEATAVTHPAHRYFAERYERELDVFTNLLRDAQRSGSLVGHDPELEAIWLVALWDGLQFLWMNRAADNVVVSIALRAHLTRVLPPAPSPQLSLRA